jgi:RNA polymerase sigma-70 factor (ECF subfamily)
LNAERARAVAEATFRREHGRIIAALIRLCGSFDRAEEAMQDAFASALANWTEQGIPDSPGAWITAASHRKLIDVARRERTRREKSELLRDDDDESAAGGVRRSTKPPPDFRMIDCD